MPRAFQFGLHAVQRLREQARDKQLRVVADVAREVATAESARQLLAARLRENMDSGRFAQQSRMLDVAAIRTGYVHQGWLMRGLESVALALGDRRHRLEAERKRLGEASARLKAIQKLRERQWLRHRAGIEREEQAAVDEAALRVYAVRPPDRADGEGRAC